MNLKIPKKDSNTEIVKTLKALVNWEPSALKIYLKNLIFKNKFFNLQPKHLLVHFFNPFFLILMIACKHLSYANIIHTITDLSKLINIYLSWVDNRN